jgi:hypothetical protein
MLTLSTSARKLDRMARRSPAAPARKRADRYHHGDLRRALLQAAVRMLRDQLAHAWEDGGRGLRGFEAMGVAYVRFAGAHPSHYRVMFGADVSEAAHAQQEEGARAFQVLVDALTALQAQKLARRDDAQQMALYVWATVHGVAMLAIDGRLGQDHTAIDALTQYATARIRAAITPTAT